MRPANDPSRTQIWNCGGGVQSTAIAVLILRGDLPKPDIAVIADTERELSTTWEYMEKYTAPALARIGVVLHRVKKSEFTKIDLFSGKNGKSLLIPAFTTQGKDVGKLPGYCSNEWKKYVVQRFATQRFGVKKACQWIGISTDELRRARQSSSGKWATRYPLIELKMSRGDCQALVDAHGWEPPPRSSCWMCPNHREDEWAWIQFNAPSDFVKAAYLERDIQKIDQHAWLHSECKPIDTIDFDDKNNVLFGGCDSGLCFT